MSGDVKTDAKIIQKQLAYQKTGTGDRRMCAGCLRHKILMSEPAWKTQCKNCFETKGLTPSLVQLGGRKCLACSRLTIAASDPEWRKICGSCYREGTRSVPDGSKRACVSCHQLNIPITAPEWKKQCFGCYRRPI